jgi:hypothetical protein
LVLVAARAVAVLKIVSQHVVSQRLLVRVTQTCTRTSASVQTLSRHVAIHAATQVPAAAQLAVLQQVRTTGAETVATLTRQAVLQQDAETVAVLTHHAVFQQDAEMVATLTHHAVLQQGAEMVAMLTHHAVLQQDAVTVATLTHHAVLQQDAVTVAMLTHHAVLQQDAATAVAKFATTTPVKLPS